jgi:hypothetical protein
MEMEEEQQQQQQQQPLHRGVVDGIARLTDPGYREERHILVVIGYHDGRAPVNRQSLQHLVDFLDDRRNSHEDIIAIKELEGSYVSFD